MGGPFMMNLKVAVEPDRPPSSHAFCAVPRIVRPGSLIAIVHDALGKVASPAPPPVQVESESVVTKPDSDAVLQQVYLAERYWRSSGREKPGPPPRRPPRGRHRRWCRRCRTRRRGRGDGSGRAT